MSDTWQVGDRVTIIDREDTWFGWGGIVTRVYQGLRQPRITIDFGYRKDFLGRLSLDISLNVAEDRISKPKRGTNEPGDS